MWTTRDIPDRTGRTAIITGATSGLGLAASRALVAAGADVVLAARNPAKAEDVMEDLQRAVPSARLSFEPVDTSDLDSVSAFAERWSRTGTPIDLLLLNAGIAAVPTRTTSHQGFEQQFATNYLGHFSLTGLLLPMMSARADTRVVATASNGVNFVRPQLDDPESEHGYRPMRAYRWSKLALLTFALELQRRLHASGSQVAALAAHPGLSRTGIGRRGSASAERSDVLLRLAARLLGQSAEQGALPLLYAATSAAASPGGYYGPAGRRELRGSPTTVHIPQTATNLTSAAQLWRLSERLTHTHFLERDSSINAP